MNKRIHLTAILTAAIAALNLAIPTTQGGALRTVGRITAKGWDEAVELAMKVSGRNLDDAGKRLLRESVEAAARRHGDDALKALGKGGVELSEAAARHGDDVWRFAAEVPDAARCLARNSGELVPLTRRIGTEVLELEVRHPGLAARVAANFGDDSVRFFAARVSSADATRLLGYAEQANTPAAREALFQAYKSTDGRILKHLSWKHIMAAGLSVAVVTAAHETADGVQEGLKTTALNSPEVFQNTVKAVTRAALLPVSIALGICILLVGWRLTAPLKMLAKKLRMRKKTSPGRE